MFNLFNKKSKIVNLTFSPFFILLFCFAGLGLSITIMTTASTSLTNHAYGELANNNNFSSFVEGPFDSNLTGIVKKNSTQTTNQDNFSDKKNMLVSKSNEILVSKTRDKNETKISSSITDSTASTSSNTNTRGQFYEVTADFNGDGLPELCVSKYDPGSVRLQELIPLPRQL